MTLGERLPEAGVLTADEILERLLAWADARGLSPYPEQEEAILELLADRHVVLSTPTGSGKSLVALALHFRALCEGRRSFYTAPVKALVSEKFFALCEELGAERVGMLTGDASLHASAPVVCCTTEVLASMALRGGERTDAPFVVLDEFHYYDDPERGMAWQIPLLLLRHARFLLMSATLGNTDPIERRLAAFTGRRVAHVHSDERPVPLAFEYRETPLHETLEDLVARDLAPVYVVNFTQRECGDLAQGATSAKLASPERRREIARATDGFRFDTAYGRDLARFLRHGIGVHHAGLLPKYRLLVERLAQQGLLVAIFGTDTLGVGVNVPIRTVVLNRLSKFDGEKVGILRVRELQQIAGRAGRKGYDERGLVVCQAPEHVIENKRLEAKARQTGRRSKAKKKAPPGFVPWNEETFRRLVESPPESLRSRFAVTHGLLLAVLQRPGGADYGAVIELVNRSHESEASKARERRRAAALFRSLVHAGVIEVVEGGFGPPEIRVRPDLQTDFSLHDTLSLYLVEAAHALDPASPDYALDLLSLVEAIQEDPRPILAEQTRRARFDLIGRLKAEGVDYEERRRRAEEVSHPRPCEHFLRESFALFARHHPWAREADVRPKSVARDLVERSAGFRDYVKEYGLARHEGLLLRYLSQVHNTLVKTIPRAAKTDEVTELVAYLRAALTAVDTSLLEAWESLVRPEADDAAPGEAPELRFDLARQPRALAARVRQELLALVRALSRRDLEEAATCVRPDPDDPWDAERFEEVLAPFHEEYGEILFTPEARRAHHTRLVPSGSRTWDVTQVLLDPRADHLWALHGEIDLRGERDPQAPLVRLVRIGT